MASIWTSQYNAPGNPKTQSQFGAIQSGANQGNLLSQLLNFGATPKNTTPNTVAASSAVKNPNAPKTTPFAFGGGSTAPVNSRPAGTNVGGATGSFAPTTPSTPTYPNSAQTILPQSTNYVAPTPGPAGTPLPQNPTPQNQPSSSPTSLAGIIASQVARGNGEETPGLVKARQHLEDIQSQAAQVNSNLGTTPGMAEAEVQGRQRNAADYYATKEAAATTALSAAQASQGQEITALGNAATAAAPIQVAPGSTAVNPQTGEQVAGGLGGYVNYQTAQQVMGQANSYPDAKNAQGQSFTYDASKTPQENIQNFQQNFLPNSPTYQKSTYGVPGQSSVAGATGVQANQDVFNKAYGEYKTLENSVQNVDQFGQLLVQNMGGINPSDVKYANQTIAQIRTQLSSAQQAQFNSTLAALVSKVSGLLSVGGNEIPTDISSAANKIIDGSLPIGSLTSVLSRIQQEGNILLQNQAKIVNDSYSGLGGTNTNSNANTNTANPWH